MKIPDLFPRILNEKYFCGLDIGGESIKAAILEIQENAPPNLVGVYQTPTKGFQNSSVSDLSELAESIHLTLSELMKKTGVKLKDVFLGINGELGEQRLSQAVIPLTERGSKIIGQRDIQKIQRHARLLGIKMDEIILHDFPQFYRVDDVNTALNPVGLHGRKLEIQSLLIVIRDTLLKNLIKAVNQAGFDVREPFYTSYASAHVALTREQKKQGCLLLDMGDRSTVFLFFKDDSLKYMSKIPIAGKHVTEKIAGQLNLPIGLAEDIKKSYALATTDPEVMALEEEILLKREEGYMPVKKGIINEGIQPIIAQLVAEIQKELKISGVIQQLQGGIVMVGGGAMLPGLPECIEEATHLPVRIGKIQMEMKRLHHSAKYASAVGLAYIGLEKHGRTKPAVEKPWPQRVSHKMRELYQEYF
ncbi:MAG: cell division protein FtsA [Candidatus Omnitrophica bacterium]|nr:cell division protein FtsA [Candidatus Omnitrophota bacterium]